MKSIFLIICWILNSLSLISIIAQISVDKYFYPKLYRLFVILGILFGFSALGFAICGLFL